MAKNKISKKSFIRGKYYFVQVNEDDQFLIRFERIKDGTMYCDLCLSPDAEEFWGTYRDHECWSFDDITYMREATYEEINWLLKCDEVDAYVEKPEYTQQEIY